MRSRRRLPLVYLALLLAVLLLPATPFAGLQGEHSTFYLTVAALAVSLHFLRHRSANWLRPDTLFLVGFVIVHFQWVAMLIMSDLTPASIDLLGPIEKHAAYGTWLSTLGLLAWLIGYSLGRPAGRASVDRVSNSHLMLAVTATIFLAFAVLAGPSYFTAELYKNLQFNLYQTVTGGAAYLLTLAEICTLIVIALFFYPGLAAHRAASKPSDSTPTSMIYPPKHRRLFLLYGIVYIAAFTAAAERGNVLQVLSAAGVIYAVNYRPVKFSELIIIGLVVALAFTAIGIIRSLDQGFSPDLIFGEFGLWGLTSNLAGSSITLYQGIDMVHSGAGYQLGQLWLSQLLGLIPFLQSAFLSVSGMSISDISASAQITEYILGPNPHTGFGTSLVIDIYLNFGAPGVLIVCLWFGHFVRLVSSWIEGSYGFSKFFVGATLVSLLLYLSRSSILFPLRTVVWGLVVIGIVLTVRRITQGSRRRGFAPTGGIPPESARAP